MRDESSTAGVWPGPNETPLGLWTAWIDQAFRAWPGATMPPHGIPAQARWQTMSPERLAGGLLEAGAKQLGATLAGNPLLRATEEALNTNPLHDIVPVNWAEMFRALGAVWFWSASHPQRALIIGADANLRAWHSTMEVWNDAWQR